jgi:hypothetical protein
MSKLIDYLKVNRKEDTIGMPIMFKEIDGKIIGYQTNGDVKISLHTPIQWKNKTKHQKLINVPVTQVFV